MIRTIMDSNLFMKTMKNRLLTAILAVVGVVILGIAIVWISSNFISSSDGEITIEYINGEHETIKKIEFKKGDSLEELLKDNFNNVKFNSGMLMSIEDYDTPSDYSTFICVYVDDVMSEVGINQIDFKDGKKISLIVTVNTYVPS